MRSAVAALLSVIACASEVEREPPVAPTHVATAEPAVGAAPTADEPPREDAAAPAIAPAPIDPRPLSFMLAPQPPLGGGADVDLLRRAQTSRTAGDSTGMKAALLALVRDHPTSPLVPHGFFLLGEHMFAAGKPRDALKLYEKAATFVGSDVVPYARHRIAWCHVKLGDDKRALESFVQAIKRALELRGDAQSMLVRASVFDSTGSFARSASLRKARDFYRFLTRGADFDLDLDDVLAHVAEAAIDADRRSELADVCRQQDSPRWCADALERP